MRSLLILIVSMMLAAASLMPAGSASAQEIPEPPDPPDLPTGLVIPPVVWQLTLFPGAGAIEQPGRYSVLFLPDGTINIRADCNWVAGFWSGGDGALDVTATMTTVAECPPDSLEEPFVQGLDEATSYLIEDMTLVISGPAGEMRFSPTMPMA